MKICVSSNDLKKALDAVMDASPSRPALPAHGCVHIQTAVDSNGYDCVILSCQDGALEIRRWLNCVVQEQGSALIQARLLRNYIAVMDGMVTISCKENDAKCQINAGKKKNSIACLPPSEYAFSAADKSICQYASLPAETLKRFVSTCAHCAGTDMTRMALTGMLLEMQAGKCMATCTSGFTFAHVEAPANVHCEGSLLIPVTSLQKASKLLGASKTPIIIQGGKTLCRMSGEGAEITFSLLTAQYVDYRRLMHYEAPTNVRVDCKELLSAVNSTAIAAADGQKNAVTVSVENGVITLKASSQNSDSVCTVDCLQYGTSIEASFNPRYMIDALECAAKEAANVTLLFKGPVSPLAIMPETEQKEKPFTPYFLVLPVRTFTQRS